MKSTYAKGSKNLPLEMLIRAKAVNMEILMKTLSPPRNSVYWKADNLEKFIGKIHAPVFSLYEITSFVIKKKIEDFGPVMGPLQHQQICSPLPTRFETRSTLSEFRKYSNHYENIKFNTTKRIRILNFSSVV